VLGQPAGACPGGHPALPHQRQDRGPAQPDRDRTGASGWIELRGTCRQRGGVLGGHPARRGARIRIEPDALCRSQGRQVGGRVGPVPGQHSQRLDHDHPADQQHQRQESEQPDGGRTSIRRLPDLPSPTNPSSAERL
jgi:hypothetical protein